MTASVQEQIQQAIALYTTRKSDGKWRTIAAIATELGVPRARVMYWLQDAGVSRGKGNSNHASKLAPEQIQDAIRLYTQENPDGTWNSLRAIGEQFGVKAASIRYALQQAGVATRPMKVAMGSGRHARKGMKRTPHPPLCRCGCGQPVSWNTAKTRWYRMVEGHKMPYQREDWLREQYEIQQRSTTEIARLASDLTGCPVAYTQVLYWMKRLRISARNRNSDPVVRAQKSKPADQNAQWKGGVTPERQRVQKTQEWREFVRAVLSRDHYTCQRCGQQCSGKNRGQRRPHAHHVRSWVEHPELRLQVSNAVTLCRPCHEWVHSSDNLERAFLAD